MNHIQARTLRGIGILCLLLAVVYPAGSSAYQRYSTAAVYGARLAWNEAGPNVRDCAAIMHIRKRTAAHHGRELEEELLALHGRRSLRPDRATNPHPRDSRPWIGDLNAQLTQPRNWTDAARWEDIRPLWLQVLETAQRVVDGRQGDPCAGGPRPSTWGGPVVDRDRIARMIESGNYVRASCGPTSNVYLARRR